MFWLIATVMKAINMAAPSHLQKLQKGGLRAHYWPRPKGEWKDTFGWFKTIDRSSLTVSEEMQHFGDVCESKKVKVAWKVKFDWNSRTDMYTKDPKYPYNIRNMLRI